MGGQQRHVVPIPEQPPQAEGRRTYGVCAALDGQPVIDESGKTLWHLVANPECRCPHGMAAMVCPYGHMLECHFPLTCAEAECEHYRRAEEEE